MKHIETDGKRCMRTFRLLNLVSAITADVQMASLKYCFGNSVNTTTHVTPDLAGEKKLLVSWRIHREAFCAFPNLNNYNIFFTQIRELSSFRNSKRTTWCELKSKDDCVIQTKNRLFRTKVDILKQKQSNYLNLCPRNENAVTDKRFPKMKL